MSRTREGFCRKLLDDDSPHRTLDPEAIAARFVGYFRLSGRPAMEELRVMLRRAGFGEVTGRHLDTVKGIHYSAPGGGYDIHYRDDLWDGGQEFTVVHETYEIIHETLWDMNSGDAPDRKVCREADRFAAAVLMQPRVLRAAGPGVWAGRAGLAAGVPLLLRLGDAAAGRGAAPSAPHGGPVREGGRGRPRRLA